MVRVGTVNFKSLSCGTDRAERDGYGTRLERDVTSMIRNKEWIDT